MWQQLPIYLKKNKIIKYSNLSWNHELFNRTVQSYHMLSEKWCPLHLRLLNFMASILIDSSVITQYHAYRRKTNNTLNNKPLSNYQIWCTLYQETESAFSNNPTLLLKIKYLQSVDKRRSLLNVRVAITSHPLHGLVKRVASALPGIRLKRSRPLTQL